jgi:TolB-like protein
MSSTLHGFEYDIFISYRHNDNHDGWVTDFVQNLDKELKATVKHPVSIYFDKNPHDGLLETHDVDKSLEGKLKSLIFIPILSQTYCDENSFAWQHEFIAFNKLVLSDSLGSHVRLANGNASGRILAVKIHDLDEGDRKTVETEIGRALRSIEFIFKSQGVNRPLQAIEDHPSDNVNKTYYRDQINKIANAVKEIIQASGKSGYVPETANAISAPRKSGKKLMAIGAAILCLCVSAYLLYPKGAPAAGIFSDKSIAVLYFDNISSEPDQEYFSDGITEEIIARLASVEGLHVTSKTSVLQFRKKEALSSMREIADKLNVATVLEGSVRKAGSRLRITVQLIDARTDRSIWTEVYDRELEDIFKIQSEIAQSIADKFRVVLSSSARMKIDKVPTRNMKAYELYLKAKSIPWGTGSGFGSYYGGVKSAKRFLQQAVTLDPNFVQAYAMLSAIELFEDSNNGNKMEFKSDSAAHYAQLALDKGPGEVEGHLAMARVFFYRRELTDSRRFFQRALEIDSVAALSAAGTALVPYDVRLAARMFTELIRINPLDHQGYVGRIYVYSLLAQFDSVRKYRNITQRLAPENNGGALFEFSYQAYSGNIAETKSLAKRTYGDDTLSYNKAVGIAYLFAKNWSEARKYYERTYYRDMDWGLLLMKTGSRDSAISVLKAVRARQIKEDDLPMNTSRVLAALGDKAGAIAEFQRMLKVMQVVNVKFLENDPFWDLIRDDPEFQKLFNEAIHRNTETMNHLKEDERKPFSLDIGTQ